MILGGYLKKKCLRALLTMPHGLFCGHLWAGAGVIAPVSWQALQDFVDKNF
jgi:hypothetical protein